FLPPLQKRGLRSQKRPKRKHTRRHGRHPTSGRRSSLPPPAAREPARPPATRAPPLDATSCQGARPARSPPRGGGGGGRRVFLCFLADGAMWGAKGEEKAGGACEEWSYQLGNKDTLSLKAPKKSPLALRMVVLTMTMICGVFICSMCMKQLGSDSWSRIVKIQVAEQSCNKSLIPPSEVQFVHYPQPLNYSRKECTCTPVRFFAIISSQRSGSGWFETLLNSHINVSSNGEIFSKKERRINISSIIKTMDMVYNLDWNSSASKNECTAAAGFKWMLNQGLVANQAAVVDYFNQRGVSVIFLFRRNLLRQMVSQLANNHDRYLKQLKGKHKAHVHTKDEANILAKYKPRLNTTTLMWSLKQADDYTRKALENLKSVRHITLYYEDLVQNRTMLVEVLDFLKVPVRKLVSRHVKIHTKPLSDQIENWDEVYNALNGTKFESFLNADYRT
uniref:Sulfotransferase n=8 Tax=Triticinae TaxID=1648030 RepID=A0A453G853_AEGTS